MNLNKYKNLIFFGELPPISRNGISYNNLRFLKEIKIYFKEIIYLKDLPHKSLISYFKTSIKLLFFFYKNLSQKNSINYFTLSQGNIGIVKSFILSLISIISNNKYIVHLHRGDLIYNCKNSHFKFLIARYILNKCFLILCISKIQKVEILSFFNLNRNKAIFIPNFLSKSLLLKSTSIQKNIENNHLSNFINIVYVGPLLKSKGIDKLLKILFKDKVRDNLINNYSLSIYGRNVDKNILARYEKEIFKNELKYYGEVTHKKVLYNIKKSNLLILPSLSEGMPYVVLESILLGTPVICTDVGYIKEIIGEKYPLFIDIRNKSSVIDKINYFYLNKIEIFNIIYKIREDIIKNYSKNNLKKIFDYINK